MVEEVAACLKVSAENVITEVEDHATRTVDNIGLPVYPGSVVAMCRIMESNYCIFMQSMDIDAIYSELYISTTMHINLRTLRT